MNLLPASPHGRLGTLGDPRREGLPGGCAQAPGCRAAARVIAGVDPGLARTGYGIIAGQEDRFEVLEAGTITTQPSQPEAVRLRLLYEQILAVFHRWAPALVAVEKLFFSRNVRSALAVGQARGVVLLAAAQVGATVVEFTPQEVKLGISGMGAGSKPQVAYMVQQLLGLSAPPGPDMADALAAALCGARWRADGRP